MSARQVWLHIATWSCLVASMGCAGAPRLAPRQGFELTRGREHPLTGRVYAAREQAFVAPEELFSAVRSADFLLLGETHDNRDQHRVQAQLLEQFLQQHAEGKLAAEMLDELDAPVLARRAYTTPEQLAEQVEWSQSGWPEFSAYRPVFEVALHAPLVAAHPSAEHVRASMRELPADEARSLHLDVPLPSAQVEAQHAEIRESHCGHAPQAMLQPMQRAQTYKDAFMARAMLQAKSPTALIAGRAHVRNDRGIPVYLRRAGARQIVSVALLDVDEARLEASDYDVGAFDFVVFTPRVSDVDPCVEFREQLERMRRSPPGAEQQPSAPPTAATYEGHGAASLAPELIEKFRPRALEGAMSRRLQSLMDVRAPGIGELTPDGKTLYFSWSITGVPQVWKVAGPRRFPEQVTGGEDRTSLAAITPDGTQLVIQRDRKGEENPGLYLQPSGGGELQPIQHIAGVQTQFEIMSDDGKSVYFTSNDRDRATYVVYRYDVATKTKSVAFDAEPALWHVADVKNDGRLLLRKETGALWVEFYEWNPGTRTLTPLFGQNEHEEYRAQYGAREGELLVLTNKLSEFRRLYRWSAGQLSPLSEPIAHDIQRFGIDRARKRILYTVNERGYTRPHALDAKSGKPIALPRLPDADHVRFGATTPNGRFSSLGVDDGRHPMQGYVLDWQTNTIAQWHAPSTPEFDTSSFARAELESYPARDGTPIPAFVRRPRSCASEPCPVVIEFHGGPEGQALPGFSLGSQAFVDAGFVLVQPNVRGSDGYGKTWLHADDGPKRLDVITDIEDAATWARTRFAVAGRAPRVGIYGGSYGGYSVLIGMTMFAGAYDAGVDIVGISDLRTFLRNTAPYRRILRINEYGDPERDAEALSKLSPIDYVDRVRAPLLIEQGASDPRVPAGEAIQIYDRLRSRSVECDLTIYPDEGHGASKRENIVLMLGHSLEFFRRHLAGERAATASTPQ